MKIAIAEKSRTDKDFRLPGAGVLMDERPMLIAATHMETLIHLRKVLSLAKYTFGSTFLAPSSLKEALVVLRFPPKIAKSALDSGFGCRLFVLGTLRSESFMGDIPLT